MSKVYIYSTLSNSQSVPVWMAYPGIESSGKGSAKPSIRQSVINIHGGANVIDRAFQTAKGTLTIVSEDQLVQLRKSSVFNKWEKAGFIKIETDEFDAEDVAEDMEPRDSSAQITGDDHESRLVDGDTTSVVDVDSPKPRQKKSAKKSAKAVD